MEQIESQAFDLHQLTQASVPVPLSDATQRPSPGGPGPALAADHSAPHSVHDGASANIANNNKRKSLDDGSATGGQAGKNTRSKRNRYISIACNECKRRKIKCNGETPCQRCGNLNLACLYAPNCCSTNFKDSEDFKIVSSQVDRLQEQVEWLNHTIKALQADSTRLAPIQDRPLPAISPSPSYQSNTTSQPPQPQSQRLDPPPFVRYGSFRGPTSMAYSLDVANNTIANMGYKGIEEGEDQSAPSTFDEVHVTTGDAGRTDPLLDYTKEEMIRLCRLHEEEIGIMYPVLDVQDVIAHASSLHAFIDLHRHQRSPLSFNDDKSLELKMVMASALLVEEHGQSDKAVRLYESAENVLNRKLVSEPSKISTLPLLALMAGYRFLSNDDVLGWRVMGQVTRLCFELGIHRYAGLMKIGDEQERKNALNSFWSAYVLDRRWAFATGLPYVVQDDEIDPQLPMPEDHPFLVAMISYSRLCAKVWRQVTHFEPVLARELRQEELERLDSEVLQWYETVPEEVRVRNWMAERRHLTSTTPSYNLQRLRIWTYLRLNQLRIWLYTPVLYSATSIMTNPLQAQRVVDLARDTIQYLHHLNSTTDLYRKVQVFYHQFITSAISAVFLASVHAPVRFSAVCREEFYLALELVKHLSAKSWVSQRLWRTIRSLKDVAPRFGLNPDDDAHSTAALGMIGLARGHMDGSSASQSPYQRAPPQVPARPQQPPQAGDNGSMLQSEMSRMFEGYVGLNGVQQQQSVNDEQGGSARPGSEMQSPGSGTVYGSDGTVFPQLREMF
ncbi:uncharacterized protein F5Z01DRAFT_627569 [Emericellopsis atlantica]|uniref:Zn(2)-C6 fungal-type domain-containing protein n=1 Tax=Emericellopsis atlantica TaxID=2614577 RepID=A0A9P8CLV7_9HYPO|nr:uncharacterized protein F5Z01DRAFT_627569 [Emericellopsis atlantica]KAG9251442.1 hypothetical protein F5Z01DRAFT_627569 [Emericellopsis atlantica]